MRTIDFIKMSLEMSKKWILGLVVDMQDAPLTVPTVNGGNHPLWVLGHLTYSEAELLTEFVLGQANPLAEWKDLFGEGSEPHDDASRYPSFDELMAKFEETRTATLNYLDSITDDDLDAPSKAPEELSDFFSTVGQCLSGMIVHFSYHGGQVADARRAAGRQSLMG